MSADLNLFTLVKNSEGKISPTLSTDRWLLEAGTDARPERADLITILNAFVKAPRGKLFNETQSHPSALRWSAAVPLVLAVFKEYRNINYSEWDWEDPTMLRLLDQDLKDLVPYILGIKDIEKFDDEAKLEMLLEAATVRSGKTAGKVKPVTSLTTITKVPRLSMYPRMLRLMILQAWVYHSSLRHSLMLLDCEDLDSMPQPLASIDILPVYKPPVIPYKSEPSSDLPWV